MQPRVTARCLQPCSLTICPPHYLEPPPPRPLGRAWYPRYGGDKKPHSLWQDSGQLTPTRGLLLLLPFRCPGPQPKAAPLESSWQQDVAQPGPNSAPDDQGTEGELRYCSLGCVTHGCPAGAGIAGGLGLRGIGKRQCITPELAALNLLLLLSSTYDSPCQELVPEGSSFLQAEEDTPCKCKAQTPSQGAQAHSTS